MKSLSLVNARKSFTKLPEKLEEEQNALAITRRGEPVMALMSWSLYEAIIETLELLEDEEMTRELKKSIGNIKSGKTIDWETAKNKLSL